MTATAVGSFLMRASANRQAAIAADQQRWLEALAAVTGQQTVSADAASDRVTGSWGHAVRRFLAVAIILTVCAMVAYLTIIAPAQVVAVDTPSRSLLGLFQWGGGQKFVTLDGAHIPSQFWVMAGHVSAYYFGLAAATPKR